MATLITAGCHDQQWFLLLAAANGFQQMIPSRMCAVFPLLSPIPFAAEAHKLVDANVYTAWAARYFFHKTSASTSWSASTPNKMAGGLPRAARILLGNQLVAAISAPDQLIGVKGFLQSCRHHVLVVYRLLTGHLVSSASYRDCLLLILSLSCVLVQ